MGMCHYAFNTHVIYSQRQEHARNHSVHNNILIIVFFVSVAGVQASWDEWWTYDGISGKNHMNYVVS